MKSIKSIKSILLFPLFPFLVFVYSICNLRNICNQIIFVCFFCIFGYCHTFTDIRADSYRKYVYFNNFNRYDVTEIYDALTSGEIKDVYEQLLFNWVKGFTDNPHIMMMIVGLVGGFLYLLVIKRFLHDNHRGLTFPVFILLMFMFIESNIAVMGGIRNFTAFPLFMYSIIKLFLDKKRIWIIGLLVTPLIHFGYILVVVAAMIIYIFKIPSNILHYICIFVCIASIFMTTSSYEGILNIGLNIIDNGSISSRMEHYGSDGTDAHFAQSLTTRLIEINNKISACFIVIFLSYIKRKKRFIIKNRYEERLYNILLYFIAISFALISFSVVGQRYVYIALVLLYMFMLNIYHNHYIVKNFIYTLPIVYVLHIAWFVYNCYCNTGLDIYYQPLPFLLLL